MHLWQGTKLIRNDAAVEVYLNAFTKTKNEAQGRELEV